MAALVERYAQAKLGPRTRVAMKGTKMAETAKLHSLGVGGDSITKNFFGKCLFHVDGLRPVVEVCR